MKKTLIATVLMVANTTLTQRLIENPISWGVPAYGGTGCLSTEDVGVQFSMRNQILEVQMNTFRLTLEGEKVLDRAKCSIRLPVKVQPGYQLVISSLELSGAAHRNQNYKIQTQVEVGFVGFKTTVVKASKAPGLTGRIDLSKKLVGSSSLASPCGQEVMLELNSSVSVQKAQALAMGAVDVSVESVRTQLSVRKCQ